MTHYTPSHNPRIEAEHKAKRGMSWMDECAPPIAWRAQELKEENDRLRTAVRKALWFVRRYKNLMPDVEDALAVDEEEAEEEREIVAEHKAELVRALKRHGNKEESA